MRVEQLLKLMAWERQFKETQDVETVAELFQDLIDSGDLQYMGAFYRESAEMLIKEGICFRPELRLIK